MRKECYWDEHGEQVERIIDDPKDRHKSRNQSGDKVAKEKEEKGE